MKWRTLYELCSWCIADRAHAEADANIQCFLEINITLCMTNSFTLLAIFVLNKHQLLGDAYIDWVEVADCVSNHTETVWWRGSLKEPSEVVSATI